MNIPVQEEGLSSQSTGRRWYVVQTLPRNENKATANLIQQGFVPFCPRLRKTVRHARRISQTLAPLFPGYLFIEMDIAQTRWRSINGTFGVSHLLMQGDCPQPVPQGIVEAIATHTDETGAIGPNCCFKIGQDVKIVDGPFIEMIGRLETLDDKGRVGILLNMMGRQVRIVSHIERLVSAA